MLASCLWLFGWLVGWSVVCGCLVGWWVGQLFVVGGLVGGLVSCLWHASSVSCSSREERFNSTDMIRDRLTDQHLSLLFFILHNTTLRPQPLSVCLSVPLSLPLPSLSPLSLSPPLPLCPPPLSLTCRPTPGTVWPRPSW